MTYTVFSGTLNLTQSISLSLCLSVCPMPRRSKAVHYGCLLTVEEPPCWKPNPLVNVVLRPLEVAETAPILKKNCVVNISVTKTNRAVCSSCQNTNRKSYAACNLLEGDILPVFGLDCVNCVHSS